MYKDFKETEGQGFPNPNPNPNWTPRTLQCRAFWASQGRIVLGFLWWSLQPAACHKVDLSLDFIYLQALMLSYIAEFQV